MSEERAIAVDLAKLTREDGTTRTLAWGDPVTVLSEDDKRVTVEVVDFETQPDGSILPKTGTGFLKRRLDSREVTRPAAEVKVLKMDFVDVQQGDGALIETPEGKTILIDGGENQLFARYLAARFRGTGADARKEIDAIVVSHGDADHFSGLTEIHDSEGNSNPAKRLFAHPQRVYHNGLVKRPKEVPDEERLGATQVVDGVTVITGLETDITAVADGELNRDFLRWKRALEAWREDGGPIEFRRLVKGDDDAFDFLSGEGIDVQVLGPIPFTGDGVTGLRFLGEPPEGPEAAPQDTPDEKFKAFDSSHTINGHSIVLRIGLGNWRIVFAGDLNTHAEGALVADHEAGSLDMRAEVLKVPHHGSAEFSDAFLDAVRPLVSVVSSGDENAQREHIHPRATLMSALGRHGRNASSVVFVTELVAFFEMVGWVRPDAKDGVNGKPPEGMDKDFFAFRRTAYGLVRVRTDGERLLVYTNSGLSTMKEAYAYTATAPGEVTPVKVLKA
jgi:beta-lactamase superfamily II metal-dependent hydrolase